MSVLDRSLTVLSSLEKYVPHAYICLALIDRFRFTNSVTVQFLQNAGSYLQLSAWYKEAEVFYQKAITILKKMYGDEHSEIALLLYKIGQLYHLQDLYKEAESFYQQALKIYMKLLDQKDNIAEVWQALGEIYHRQGLYQQAEASYKQSISYYAEMLDEGVKPDIAIPIYQQGFSQFERRRVKSERAYSQRASLKRSLSFFMHPPRHLAETLISWQHFTRSKVNTKKRRNFLKWQC